MRRRPHPLCFVRIRTAVFVLGVAGTAVGQAPLADGLLGLTQSEIREKFGRPQEVEIYRGGYGVKFSTHKN